MNHPIHIELAVLHDFSSTSNYLAHFARLQPHAPAFVQDGKTYSYVHMAGLVANLVRRLGEFSIAPNAIVGIECDDHHIHLALLLACERIGVRSLSLLRNELQSGGRFAQLCDFVLTQNAPEILGSRRGVALSDDWLSAIERAPWQDQDLALLEAAADPQRVTRIVRTSGTTGAPKVLQLTNAFMQRHIKILSTHPYEQVTGPIRFVLFYGFAVQLAYIRSCWTFQAGGTVIVSTDNSFFKDIQRYAANYSNLLTGDAERLLAMMPPTFPKPAHFVLPIAGSTIPPRLRTALTERLASQIVNNYACNEAGRVCVFDEQGVGTLDVDTEVEIVNDQGVPVGYGTPGRIRVRTSAMLSGYMDDPALTAASFIDGWFQTSDIGLMPTARRLVVLGRVDEMLNIGGLKVPPSPIEERLKAVKGVRDAVAVSIEPSGDVGVLGVAVEAGPDVAVDTITAELRNVIEQYIGRCKLMVVNALPRTETGKVIKRDVEAWFR